MTTRTKVEGDDEFPELVYDYSTAYTLGGEPESGGMLIFDHQLDRAVSLISSVVYYSSI